MLYLFFYLDMPELYCQHHSSKTDHQEGKSWSGSRDLKSKVWLENFLLLPSEEPENWVFYIWK